MHKTLRFLIIGLLSGLIFPLTSQAQTPPGNALDFAGTLSPKNYVEIPDPGNKLSVSNNTITIEAWVKPTRKADAAHEGTSLSNKWNTIMMKGSYGYGLVIGDDNCQSTAVGKLGYWGQEACENVPYSTKTINYDHWNHVAVVINNGNLTFYINGEAAGTKSGVLVPDGGANSSLFLGVQDGPTGGNGVFYGAMDEIRIWSIVRSATDIKNDMYNTVNTTSSGLLAYYRFDTGTAASDNTGLTTLTDETANGLNGTLYNFSLSGSSSNWVESYAMVVPKAASASTTNLNSFTANWTAPEVGTVNNYLLDVAADSSFTSLVTGYDAKDAGTSTSASVSGLNPGTTYYYRVRANKTSPADVTNTGAYSAIENVTTNSKPVAGRGKAITLEKSNSEGIDIQNNTSLNFGTGSFTIEAWVKRPSGTGLYTIAGKQNNAAASVNNGYYLRFQGNALAFAAGTSDNANAIDFSPAFTDNTWHHVVGVRDVSAGKVLLYVDGKEVAGTDFATPVSVNSSADFGIGMKPTYSNEYFDGSIDEVRIWNTARTQAQIKEFMNTPLNGTETSLVGYWNFEEASGTIVHDQTSNNNNGTLSGNGNEWSDGNIPYTDTLNEDTSAALRLGGSDLDDQSSATAVISTLPAYGKLYQTDDGTTKGPEITSTGTSLSDAAGNPRRVIYEPNPNYNGSDTFAYSVNDGTYSSDNTQTVNLTVNPVNDAPVAGFQNALSFNGSNNYVNIPDNASLRPSGGITLEAWIKPQYTGDYQFIIGKEGPQEDYLFAVDKDKHLHGRFQVTGGGWRDFTTSATITLDQWQHVAVTYDNATVKVYINGNESETFPWNQNLNLSTSNNTPVTIGIRNSDKLLPFKGQIDEPQIWNRALTQAEVSESMYKNTSISGLAGYWKLNEGGGITVYDSSPEGNNGTLINSPAYVSSTISDFSTDEDTPYSGILTGSDRDGDAITYSIATNGTKGTAVITNTTTGAFTYTPNANENGTDSFTYKVNDGSSDSNTGTVNISIDPVNDAPVLDISPLITFTAIDEDATNSTGDSVAKIVADNSITDADNRPLKVIAVTSVENTNGTWQYSTDSGSNWSDISVSANSALVLTESDRMRFVPDANYNGTAALKYRAYQDNRNLELNGTDSYIAMSMGNTPLSNMTFEADLRIDALPPSGLKALLASNDWSGNNTHINFKNKLLEFVLETGGSWQSGIDFTPYIGSWIHLAITWDGTATHEVKLYINGVLIGSSTNAFSSSTLTLNDLRLGAWSGDAARNLDAGIRNVRIWNTTRTQNQVTDDMSNLLNGNESGLLAWLPMDEESGTTAADQSVNTYDGTVHNPLWVTSSGTTVDPSANGGTSRISAAEETATITINPVNDAPAATVPDSIAVTEDAASVITGISFTDPDAGTANVSITFSVDSGSLAASATSGVSVNGSGTDTLTLTGSIAAINSFIAASNITFTTAGNAVTDVTLSTTINDEGSTGSGGAKTANKTTALTVTPVNDAPVLSGGPYQFPTTTIIKDSSPKKVSDMLSALTYTDADTGAQKGIAVTGSTGNSDWQYSLDGTIWTNFGDLSSAALLLSEDTWLRYHPDSIHNETPTFTFRCWDGTSGSASSSFTITATGGSSAFSTGAATAKITVKNPAHPVSVSSSADDGDYKTGSSIPVTITFNETVAVTGTPQLTLETGSTDRTINYISGSGTPALTFSYTVQSGDENADLDYTSASALSLNGGTIKDSTENTAILTLLAPGATNSLGANKNITIDTETPDKPVITAISSDTGASNSDAITSDQTLIIKGTAEANATIEVFNGSSSIGSTTADNSGNWTFDNTTDTLAAGNYTFTAKAKDAAGNVSTASTGFSVTIDTTSPTLSAVNISSNNANPALAKTGDMVTLSFTANEKIQTPEVSLAGHAATATNITGHTWKATFTLSNSDTEGTIPFTIDFYDIAGNAGITVNTTDTVTFDHTPPNKPTGFAVTSGNTKDTLNWVASSETDVAAYKIYGGTSANPATVIKTITAPSVTYIHTGLTNGTAYYYRISAVDQAGNESSLTSDVNATPQASQTITFNALTSKTYGDTAFKAGASASSGLTVTYSSSNTNVATVSGDTITIVGAGTTTITASQPGNPAFLAAADVVQELTVNPKDISVSLNASPAITKVYNGTGTAALASGNYTLNGILNDDDVSISGTANYDNKNAGTGKTVTANNFVLAGTKKSNYNLTTTEATTTGTITKKDVTLSLNSDPEITRIYDGTTAALLKPENYQLNGIEDGDTVSVSGTANYDNKNAGTGKAITADTFVLAGNQKDNYNLATTTATTTGIITKQPLTVTVNNKSKTYGDENPVLTVSYDGLVNGETSLNPAPAISTTADASSGVGIYDIEASGNADNYTITFVKGKLTVNKKALTVTADDKVKFIGSANPQLTVSYAGFVNGDDENVLTIKPAAVTTATPSSGLGEYPITASGASSNNYDIRYVPGILKIVPGTPTNIALTAEMLFENRPAGTVAGKLSSTSDDPNATFSYSLVPGTGDSDNNLFSIIGDELKTATSLNYEDKTSYKIRVKSTTQFGFSLEKEFIVSINDVNEAPTLDEIYNQAFCYTTALKTVILSGISAGEDTGQSTSLSVSSSNPGLLSQLSVSGNEVKYRVKEGGSGTAEITVTVKDNGGTADGGADTFSRTFTLTVNPLPAINITSDIGTEISKGAEAHLTANSNGVNYQWASAEGIVSGQNSATLTVRPSQTTTYRVIVTNSTGCTSEKEITIHVAEDYRTLNANNIMSPDGDGVNDKLEIKNIDMYPDNTMKIFDRAGRLLYSKKNYNNEWDGTFNGVPLAEGTYYYIIDFGPVVGKIKGFVTIIRK